MLSSLISGTFWIEQGVLKRVSLRSLLLVISPDLHPLSGECQRLANSRAIISDVPTQSPLCPPSADGSRLNAFRKVNSQVQVNTVHMIADAPHQFGSEYIRSLVKQYIPTYCDPASITQALDDPSSQALTKELTNGTRGMVECARPTFGGVC